MPASRIWKNRMPINLLATHPPAPSLGKRRGVGVLLSLLEREGLGVSFLLLLINSSQIQGDIFPASRCSSCRRQK